MRVGRLLFGLVLAAALAPGILVRSPQPVYSVKGLIDFRPIEVERAEFGAFTLEQAWEITGDPTGLGGFSAMIDIGGGRFLAGTDAGSMLEFSRPDIGDPDPSIAVLDPRRRDDKFARDLESLTRDPQTGEFWGAYELTNSIARFSPDKKMELRVRPASMRDWGENSGPEAFVRFADGRFLAIEEKESSWNSAMHRAVLFEGDPVRGAVARELTVRGIAGFRPVDMLPLDDTRALVLFRDLQMGPPPGFATAIGLIDIAGADDEKILKVEALARFSPPFLFENYEGMVLTNDPDGQHLWLISDDNFMRYQRSLLLKLRWNRPQARQKARE